MDQRTIYAYDSPSISNEFIWEVAEYGYSITTQRFEYQNEISEEPCIVPALNKKAKGMKHHSYHPLRNANEEVLFDVFARLWTDDPQLFQEKLLGFINKYGPLTELSWKNPDGMTPFSRRHEDDWGYLLPERVPYDFMQHTRRIITSYYSIVPVLHAEVQKLSIMQDFWSAILHRDEEKLKNFIRPKEVQHFPSPGLNLFGLNQAHALPAIWEQTGNVWQNGKPPKMPADIVKISRCLFMFLLDRHMKSFSMTLTRVLRRDGKTGFMRVLPANLIGCIWYQFFQYVCGEEYEGGILVRCVRGSRCTHTTPWGVYSKENSSEWIRITRKKYKGLFCHKDCYAAWNKSIERENESYQKKAQDKKNAQRRERRVKKRMSAVSEPTGQS